MVSSRYQNQLKPGGVFALWSNDPPSEAFTARLRSTFATAAAHNIEFPNPYTGLKSVNSVYTGAALAPLLTKEGWHRFGDGVVLS